MACASTSRTSALRRGDDRVFDQLFRCKFLDGDQQYIPSEPSTALSPNTAIYDGETFGRLDIGRTNDSTTLYVVRRSLEDGLPTSRRTSSQRLCLDDIYRMVNDGFACGDSGRICVDATGMGEFLPSGSKDLRRAARRAGLSPQGSKGCSPRRSTKQFAKGIIRNPGRRPRAPRGPRFARRIVTAAGNVRYDAPTTAEGYADRGGPSPSLSAAIRQPGNLRTVRAPSMTIDIRD